MPQKHGITARQEGVDREKRLALPPAKCQETKTEMEQQVRYQSALLLAVAPHRFLREKMPKGTGGVGCPKFQWRYPVVAVCNAILALKGVVVWSP